MEDGAPAAVRVGNRLVRVWEVPRKCGYVVVAVLLQAGQIVPHGVPPLFGRNGYGMASSSPPSSCSLHSQHCGHPCAAAPGPRPVNRASSHQMLSSMSSSHRSP